MAVIRGIKQETKFNKNIDHAISNQASNSTNISNQQDKVSTRKMLDHSRQLKISGIELIEKFYHLI